jgi:hypothetical protein
LAECHRQSLSLAADAAAKADEAALHALLEQVADTDGGADSTCKRSCVAAIS